LREILKLIKDSYVRVTVRWWICVRRRMGCRLVEWEIVSSMVCDREFANGGDGGKGESVRGGGAVDPKKSEV
jgi:hypothetical protein